jgi:hypothetical protein
MLFLSSWVLSSSPPSEEAVRQIWCLEHTCWNELSNCKLLGFIVGVVPCRLRYIPRQNAPLRVVQIPLKLFGFGLYFFINSIKLISKHICDIGWKWYVKSKIDNSPYKARERTWNK